MGGSSDHPVKDDVSEVAEENHVTKNYSVSSIDSLKAYATHYKFRMLHLKVLRVYSGNLQLRCLYVLHVPVTSIKSCIRFGLN